MLKAVKLGIHEMLVRASPGKTDAGNGAAMTTCVALTAAAVASGKQTRGTAGAVRF